MKKYHNFQDFWKDFESKSVKERQRYFYSLNKQERKRLIEDLFSSKLSDLIAQNLLDHQLHYIKTHLKIDLVQIRTQAIMLNKISLVPKKVMEKAIDIIMKFEGVYNINSVFGGLVIQDWGKNNSYCRIRNRRS